jgi:hypothetical protein
LSKTSRSSLRLLGSGRLHLDAVGSHVEVIELERIDEPGRDVGDMSGEPGHGAGLGMRFPGKLVVGNTFEGLSSGGHFLIEFGKRKIADRHWSACSRGEVWVGVTAGIIGE